MSLIPEPIKKGKIILGLTIAIVALGWVLGTLTENSLFPLIGSFTGLILLVIGWDTGRRELDEYYGVKIKNGETYEEYITKIQQRCKDGVN